MAACARVASVGAARGPGLRGVRRRLRLHASGAPARYRGARHQLCRARTLRGRPGRRRAGRLCLARPPTSAPVHGAAASRAPAAPRRPGTALDLRRGVGLLRARGLGVMSTTLAAVDTVLSARYVRGSVSLSLGDVVAFGLTVWAAFRLSS